MSTKIKCCVPGCDRLVKVMKHRLCNCHLVRYYRTGTTLDKKGRTEIVPKLKDKFKVYKPQADKALKYHQHKPYGEK